MRPTWLIEANVSGLPAEELKAEIRRQGGEVEIVKFFPGMGPPGDISGSASLGHDACVIFTGTFALMRHLQTARDWRPGGWCHFANLACSTYYPRLGPCLLNRNYGFWPIAEAIRLSATIIARFGVKGRVFVRPDDADKLFTGTVVDEDDFQQLLKLHASAGNNWILAAEPRQVIDEWRCFLANGRVISAGQYRAEGEVTSIGGAPNEVQAFAEQAIQQSRWTPEPLFSMDIGRTPEGLHVVELGSFSCAGPGACPLEPIVRAANEAALRCW